MKTSFQLALIAGWPTGTSSNTEQAPEEQKEAITQEDVNTEQHLSTPLLIIEPLPYSLDSELTGVPMTASMTPTNEEGSSSIEPITWGRIESSKCERYEHEIDYRLWDIGSSKSL